MKLIILVLLTLLGTAVYAQVSYDSLILTKLNKDRDKVSIKERKKGLVFSMLHFYKKNISEQIINDCIYEVSCSEFSHQLFENYSMFKGVFLTMDRLSRCNRLSYQDVQAIRLNAEGKIIDRWEDYQIGL